MRLLECSLVCACALVGAAALGADAGASAGVGADVGEMRASSSTRSSSGGIGAGHTSSGRSATAVGVTGGTKAGQLEKAAGKSAGGGGEEKGLGAQFGSYFLNRWYDLVDIVDFSFGAGPGIMFQAHATKLLQAGGGWSDAYHVGFRGRSAGIWKEQRKEVGVSLLYYQKVQRERITGWVESFRTEKMDLDTSAAYANNNDRSFLGVGATVQAGILVDVNVRPMQAIDFVLGWMTIDVLEDDTGKPKRNKDL